MTVDGLIKEALRRANQGLISDQEAENYLVTYNTQLEAALVQNREQWLFSYDVAENLNTTDKGSDLDYKYKYLMPGDTLTVLAINPESRFGFASSREALRFGYAIVNQDLASNFSAGVRQTRNFILIDSAVKPILHTDEEVTKVFYSKKVLPSTMDPLFREYFIWRLAHTFVIIKDPKNYQLRDNLKSERNSAHIAALSRYLARPSDPQLAAIYDWVRYYLVQTTARY